MSLPSEHDRAARDRQDAGDEVEDGRFAGSVRADEAYDLAFGDMDVEVADRLQPTESLGESLNLEKHRPSPPSCCHAGFTIRSLTSFTNPTMPSGMVNAMMSSMAAVT